MDPHRPIPKTRLRRLGDELGDRVGWRVRAKNAHRRATAVAVALVAGYTVVVAALVAVGVALTNLAANGPIGRGDLDVTRWLSEHRDGTLNAVSNVLSRSADTMGAVGIALVVAVVLAIRRHWREIGTLFLGLSLELLAFLAVNTVVGRPRPHVSHLGGLPSTSSFPSGHTAATVVIYLSVALFVSATVRRQFIRALAWVAAVVMPLAVGLARVYRGMHNPLDVVAGLVLGVAVVVVAIAVFRAAETAAAPAGTRAVPHEPAHKLKAVA